MQKPINLLKTDGTTRLRWRRPRGRVFTALSVGLLVAIIVMSILALSSLFSDDSRFGILPPPPSEYLVELSYKARPADHTVPPLHPDAVYPQGRTHKPVSGLIIRNHTNSLVTGVAGQEAFQVSPGKQVSLIVEAGWLDVSGDVSGVTVTRRVFLRPNETGVCTFRIDNDKSA